jgi:hypothetical protein
MKKNISYFFLFSGIISILTLPSCDTTEVPPVKPFKDPRTYTWTIDTLINSFQTDLRRIWANAPNDVYIGGHNASSLSPGALWHFDGIIWKPVELPVATFDVNGIFGFSSSDVWAVGETATDVSLILHYDGKSWQNYSNTTGKALRCIWGSNLKNIWAGGANSLFHYDGSNWNKFPFFIPSQGVQLGSMNGLSASDIYMVGYRNDVIQPIDTSFYYLYHYNGSQWSVVDSNYITNDNYRWNFGVIIKTIGGELYSASDRLYKKEANGWKIINDDQLVFSLGGSGANNVFCATTTGTLYHFNGTDWQIIVVKGGFQLPIYDIWTDGTEAFMIASDSRQSYVIHGK